MPASRAWSRRRIRRRFRFLGTCGERRKAGEEFVEGGVAAVTFEEELVALLRGIGEEARTDFRAEPSLRHQIVQYLRHREPLPQLAFECAGRVFPDIEPGHIRDQERAEEGHPEAEGAAADLVHLARGREAIL